MDFNGEKQTAKRASEICLSKNGRDYRRENVETIKLFENWKFSLINDEDINFHDIEHTSLFYENA